MLEQPTPDDRAPLVVSDEAHSLPQVPTGRALLDDLARNSRRRNYRGEWWWIRRAALRPPPEHHVEAWTDDPMDDEEEDPDA